MASRIEWFNRLFATTTESQAAQVLARAARELPEYDVQDLAEQYYRMWPQVASTPRGVGDENAGVSPQER